MHIKEKCKFCIQSKPNGINEFTNNQNSNYQTLTKKKQTQNITFFPCIVPNLKINNVYYI